VEKSRMKKYISNTRHRFMGDYTVLIKFGRQQFFNRFAMGGLFVLACTQLLLVLLPMPSFAAGDEGGGYYQTLIGITFFVYLTILAAVIFVIVWVIRGIMGGTTSDPENGSDEDS
jgi:hypothetical protein